MNENENTITQNLWDSVKTMLRGRFIAIEAYLKKQERNQISNLTLHLKQLVKEEMKNRRVSSHQLLSRVWLFATPWTAARQASLSITNSWSPPKPMSIESVMPLKHLILCRPLLLLLSIFPSTGSFQMSQLFTSGGQSIGVSLQHHSFLWTPRLISFRMDWLNLLAGQGTLKSLLQYHSSKESILRHSTFFIVKLLHQYMTNGKTIVLTRQNFVGKVMSLLFTMLFRLVITFLPRSKRLLISWLQSQSAVIWEPPKINSATVSTVSPSICHEMMGPDAMILVFWLLSFKPTFHSPLSLSSRAPLVLFHFLP